MYISYSVSVYMKPLIPRFRESVDSQEKVLRNFKKNHFLRPYCVCTKTVRK